MATSAVEIVNSALIKAGSDRITSLSDSNERAVVANEQYSKIRDRVLRSHPWKFAIANTTLAKDATYDPGGASADAGYDYRYLMTSDMLRVILINNEPDTDWQSEGGYIYTNETSPLTVKYIKQVTDTTLFDSSFEECLSLLLARDLAYRLNQSLSLVQSLDKQYKEALAEARSYSAQEGTFKTFISDDWFNSRY